MRCLVAEGSATTRQLIANALRRLGADEVVAHGSYDEALAACTSPFDVIVVDRDLAPGPDWDWLSLLRDRGCPPGRLLVVGTRVHRDEAMAMRAAGTGAFLLKPIDPSALVARVSRMLDNTTAARPAQPASASQARAA